MLTGCAMKLLMSAPFPSTGGSACYVSCGWCLPFHTPISDSLVCVAAGLRFEHLKIIYGALNAPSKMKRLCLVNLHKMNHLNKNTIKKTNKQNLISM